MRAFIIFGTVVLFFVGFSASAVVPHQNKSNIKTSIFVKNGKNEVAPSSTLADIIQNLLKLTVAELIRLINETILGMEMKIELAMGKLESALDLVNPDIKNRLEIVATSVKNNVEEIIEPIAYQMSQIIPAISMDPQIHDFASDIIEAILGKSLEELLTGITKALVSFNSLIYSTIYELDSISKEVDGEANELIKNASLSFMGDAQALLRPLLEKLRQLFPDAYNEPITQIHI